jgi:hypothetical protein
VTGKAGIYVKRMFRIEPVTDISVLYMSLTNVWCLSLVEPRENTLEAKGGKIAKYIERTLPRPSFYKEIRK